MKIKSIKEIPYNGYVYTPQVKNNNNYYMGEQKILSKNCQNFSIDNIKLILSRVSKDSIVIALGSLNQIDSPLLTKNNNALSGLMRKSCEEQSIPVRTVVLKNIIRSEIAEWVDRTFSK